MMMMINNSKKIKNSLTMNKKILFVCWCAVVLFAACSKSDVNITPVNPVQGNFIKDGDTLNTESGSNGRAIKGTLKAGGTYYLNSNYGDAVVNTSDTLLVQSGVKVYFAGLLPAPLP
jgi:hypothetical protein